MTSAQNEVGRLAFKLYQPRPSPKPTQIYTDILSRLRGCWSQIQSFSSGYTQRNPSSPQLRPHSCRPPVFSTSDTGPPDPPGCTENASKSTTKTQRDTQRERERETPYPTPSQLSLQTAPRTQELEGSSLGGKTGSRLDFGAPEKPSSVICSGRFVHKLRVFSNTFVF